MNLNPKKFFAEGNEIIVVVVVVVIVSYDFRVRTSYIQFSFMPTFRGTDCTAADLFKFKCLGNRSRDGTTVWI